jgi:hypothetical protein
MPKSLSGAGPPRRPRARAGASSKRALATENLGPPPEAGGDPVVVEPTASGTPPNPQPTARETAATEMVLEPPARPGRAARPRKYKPPAAPRFRIFIIDSGWNSVARRVLRHNFALIRRLHKEDLLYLLSRKKSVEFIRRHRSLIGRDPIIAVHDLEAMRGYGTTRFHGFHLHLGIMRTPRQALLALQNFAQFVSTYRHSENLEAEIRTELRREGIVGAVEILLRKAPRALGG